MSFEVIRKRRVFDLTKTAGSKVAKMVSSRSRPRKAKQGPVHIGAAPDGPSIAPQLPEGRRKIEGRVANLLTEKQVEILDRIIQRAGDGYPKTLGLRLVLAASEDEIAAAWPIGLLSKALRVSGRPTEADAVHRVALGCRLSQFKGMAAAALPLLNKRLQTKAE